MWGRGVIVLDAIRAELGGNPVLKGISVALAPGKAVALLGANGAGKTTLLRALAGLVPTTGGSLSRNGQSFCNTDPGWISLVSYVADKNMLFPELSALEHFEVARRLWDIGAAETRRREALLLGLLRIQGEEAAAPVRELSFGYQKRVALALSLFVPAELYLFDEPSTGLDLDSIGIFEYIVDFLRRAGKYIIISTHNADWISSLTDARLVIAAGYLAGTGGPEGVGQQDRDVAAGGLQAAEWLRSGT